MYVYKYQHTHIDISDQTQADGPYYRQPWKGMKETTPIICGGMNAILNEPQGNQVFCQMNECIWPKLSTNGVRAWISSVAREATIGSTHVGPHSFGLSLVTTNTLPVFGICLTATKERAMLWKCWWAWPTLVPRRALSCPKASA